MSTILFPFPDPFNAAERAQTLADDLRRIVAGDLPTLADLEGAPVIDCWSVSIRPEFCLVGTISGHPAIGLMRPGMTTGIQAFAPDHGWIRTTSRFYALGRPAGDDGRQQ